MSPRSNFEVGLYEWHIFVQRGKTRGKSLKGKRQSGGKGLGPVERDASEGQGTGLHSIPLAGSLTTHKSGKRKSRMAFFFPLLTMSALGGRLVR